MEIELDKHLLLAFETLHKRWGEAYVQGSVLTVPTLPTEAAGSFVEPNPGLVARSLRDELGSGWYRRFLLFVLKLRTKEAYVRLVRTLGKPPERFCFFYLEAIYFLVATFRAELKTDSVLLETLVRNLLSFSSSGCGTYLLGLLQIPLEILLPILRCLLYDNDESTRSNTVLFFYEARRFSPSTAQLGQIRAMLEERLPLEANEQVRAVIERELSCLNNRLNPQPP
jgi:hypothetical protein